jgi:hypothetical protein
LFRFLNFNIIGLPICGDKKLPIACLKAFEGLLKFDAPDFSQNISSPNKSNGLLTFVELLGGK